MDKLHLQPASCMGRSITGFIDNRGSLSNDLHQMAQSKTEYPKSRAEKATNRNLWKSLSFSNKNIQGNTSEKKKKEEEEIMQYDI